MSDDRLTTDASDATHAASAAYDMEIRAVREEPAEGTYLPLTFMTSRGEVRCHYYVVPDTRAAVIWVGGVGGGFDSPANHLYPRLARAFQTEGVASLRIQYRHPTELEECVLDVLAGIGWLENEGIERLALVGHSLGGAVVIQAGTASDGMRAVVTLATQSYGADAVADLGPACGILLLHGRADTVLSPHCSQFVFELAHEPRKLVFYDGAGHALDEVAAEVERVVRDWLRERLD